MSAQQRRTAVMRTKAQIAERLAGIDKPPMPEGVVPLNAQFFGLQRMRDASAAKVRSA